MALETEFAGRSVLLVRLLWAGLAALGIVSAPAYADLKVIVGNSVVTQGSGGSSFDVYLENLGPDPVDIAGFSFQLSVSNPGITFLGAFTSTENLPLNSPFPPAAYIFAGHSLFGPIIDTSPSGGNVLIASDLFDIVDQGATVGVGPLGVVALGRVAFAVAGSVDVGSYPVSLAVFPDTSFSDPVGNLLTPVILQDGQIGVNAVPELSSAILLLSMSALFAVAAWCKGRFAKKAG